MAVKPATRPTDGTQLWERWEGETEAMWVAFVAYRDQPPGSRTVAESYRVCTGREGVVEAGSYYYDLCAANQWRERAAAWDRERDRIRTQAILEADAAEIRELRKLARKGARTLVETGVTLAGGLKVGEVHGDTVARIMDAGLKHVRGLTGDDVMRAEVTAINGGSTPLAALAERADELTAEEIVAQYRQITTEERRAKVAAAKGD